MQEKTNSFLVFLFVKKYTYIILLINASLSNIKPIIGEKLFFADFDKFARLWIMSTPIQILVWFSLKNYHNTIVNASYVIQCS